KYIYVDSFIKAGKEYIEEKNIDIDPNFINNYLVESIEKNEMLDIPTGKFSIKIGNSFNKHLFEHASKSVKDNNSERTSTINKLKSFLNFIKLRMPSIYTQFAILKKLLEELGINPSNQLAIFLETIETNYSCYSQSEFRVFNPDYEKMLNHRFKNFTKEQITDIVKNNKIESFLRDDNPKAKKAQEELIDFMEKNSIDDTDCQKECVKLVQAIRKKMRTEEDNEIIKSCMDNLHFSDLTYRLFRYLDRKNDEEINIEITVGTIEKDKNSKEEVSIPKKQTNLNQILREINKYYDVDNRELKEFLSLDEIIYILSLMYSIDIQEEVVESFLRSAMREFKSLHPYAIYNQGYDKFVFLSEKNPEVKEHIEMIKYILSEASIFMSSNEKYIETKKLVEEEMKELINLTNGNYRYEIESAKKLYKENQE
ncbi:MAG: hypothetical protein K2I70_03720, partial [Bacilli bacterium]|nr:hypothetical protein [Bacilli bacterium]